jgi:hypothetical protein
MHQAYTIIRAEHFTPKITAQLLNIFDTAWAECEMKDAHLACTVAAALCALARSGQNGPPASICKV